MPVCTEHQEKNDHTEQQGVLLVAGSLVQDGVDSPMRTDDRVVVPI